MVLAARIAPGFFLATAAGVIVDRLDRKRVMLFCDVGRALVFFGCRLSQPARLILASFVLEILTLWSPAKEAVVNIVPKEKLTANCSMWRRRTACSPWRPARCAPRQTLRGLRRRGWVNTWQFNEEGLAFYVNGLSFLATAAIIGRIPGPAAPRGATRHGAGELI